MFYVIFYYYYFDILFIFNCLIIKIRRLGSNKIVEYMWSSKIVKHINYIYRAFHLYRGRNSNSTENHEQPFILFLLAKKNNWE